MPSTARIPFGNSLIDPNQPVTLSLTTDSTGKPRIVLEMGIHGDIIPGMDTPPATVSQSSMDFLLNSDRIGTVNIANIKMAQTAPGSANVSFSIAFTGVVFGKIPGTGGGFHRFDFATETFQ